MLHRFFELDPIFAYKIQYKSEIQLGEGFKEVET